MLEIIQPGIHSSLQSSPRTSALAKGISMGGWADYFSAKMANLLLNQEANLAVLELVSSPFRAKIMQDCLCSFSGAGMLWEVEQKQIITNGSIAFLPKDAILVGKPTRTGYRAYVGIKSGFKAASFEGSYSTDLRLKKGGTEGLLQKGDLLFPNQFNQETANDVKLLASKWHLNNDLFSYSNKTEIRLLPSYEYDLFDDAERRLFQECKWQVSPQSNRIGIRLATENPASFKNQQMYSSTVLPGTVQITPNGPIVLLQDAHTAGGYPRMGQVIEADLPILGQKRPGDSIKFSFVTIEEALHLKKQQTESLLQIAQAIKWKLKGDF